MDLFWKEVFKDLMIYLRQKTNAQAAEDLCGDIMLTAVENEYRFKNKPLEQFRKWIFRVAKNRVRRWYIDKRIGRKNMANVDIDLVGHMIADPNYVDDNLTREELNQMIAHAMQQLTEKQRMVITYRRSQGLSFEEIAEITGEKINTLRARYKRAMGKLVKLLENYLSM